MKHKIHTVLRMIQAYKNWIRLILYRMNILPSSMVIETRDGCRICVRDRRKEISDAYVANEVWLYGIHNSLLPYMKNAKVGIDLGGHIGTFSIWAARHSPAKIYAFEPAENNLKMLEENIGLNDLRSRVQVVPKIVSELTGQKNLYLVENSGLISTLEEYRRARLDSGKFIGAVRTNSITLKDFFESEKINECDFMKVDVEGGEYAIFMSLPDIIYKKIRTMSIEIGSREDELIPHIVGKGFDMYQPDKDYGGNYIFIRK